MPGQGNPYTIKDKKAVLRFLIKENAFCKVKGNVIWKEMAEHVSGHPWQSLKEHFKKKLYPNLHYPEFELTKQEITNFRQGYNGTCRVTVQPSRRSPSPEWFRRGFSDDDDEPVGNKHSGREEALNHLVDIASKEVVKQTVITEQAGISCDPSKKQKASEQPGTSCSSNSKNQNGRTSDESSDDDSEPKTSHIKTFTGSIVSSNSSSEYCTAKSNISETGNKNHTDEGSSSKRSEVSVKNSPNESDLRNKRKKRRPERHISSSDTDSEVLESTRELGAQKVNDSVEFDSDETFVEQD